MMRMIGIPVVPKILALASLLGAPIALPAVAATPACPGVDTALTASLKSEYATSVAKATGGKVKPSQVQLIDVMRAGD